MFYFSSKGFVMFEAVLFDLDGTLVDSLPLYFDAFSKTIDALGGKISKEIFQTGGRQSWDDLEWLKRTDVEIEEGMVENFRSYIVAFFRQSIKGALHARKGVEELLLELLKKGMLLGLVSHSSSLAVQSVIEEMQWNGVFMTHITHDDVVKSKPDPEGYLLGARNLEVEPQNCLVFEDSPSGLQAVKSAGMKCVVCPDPFIGFDQRDFVGADWYLDSFLAVKDLQLF